MWLRPPSYALRFLVEVAREGWKKLPTLVVVGIADFVVVYLVVRVAVDCLCTEVMTGVSRPVIGVVAMDKFTSLVEFSSILTT